MNHKNNLIIGSHISLNKKNKYLVGVIEESIFNGANTFMIFTGAPHNKKRIPIDQMHLQEAKILGESHKIFFKNAVVHAPYIINLCNPIPTNEEFNINQMVQEIIRTHQMGIKYIVLHPGYHVQQTKEEGIERLIKNLNKVLKKVHSYNQVIICLETMPGKKNQLGSSIEELAQIITGCNRNQQLGICLDTVHLHDSGYDVSKREILFKKINDLIGWERVKVLHLGDSSGEMGCRRDKHANFEYGKIGFKVLMEWAYDEKFRNVPIIIETPFWISKDDPKKNMSPYQHEIKLIKNKKWEPIPKSNGFRTRS